MLQAGAPLGAPNEGHRRGRSGRGLALKVGGSNRGSRPLLHFPFCVLQKPISQKKSNFLNFIFKMKVP